MWQRGREAPESLPFASGLRAVVSGQLAAHLEGTAINVGARQRDRCFDLSRCVRRGKRRLGQPALLLNLGDG